MRLLAVSCNGADDDLTDLRKRPGRVSQAEESKLPTYADPAMPSLAATWRWCWGTGFAYPTTMVLDQQGVIRAVWIGYDRRDWRPDLKNLVGELLDAKTKVLSQTKPSGQAALQLAHGLGRALLAVTAPPTAIRVKPAGPHLGQLSAVMPPMAKAGRRISRGDRSQQIPIRQTASKCLVCDGNNGPTPM